MAVIKLQVFGGEVPSLSARSLPADKARISANLHPGVSEFRPLRENKMVATLAMSNPLSLHRLERKGDGTLNDDPSTGWLPYTGLRSFAKGQVNDDLTGRTYYSFDDGSAPPRVMDAGVNPARDGLPVSAAVDKLLGIPPPKAPQVELLVGDELTHDEFADLMKLKTAEVATQVRSCASFQLVGAYVVGASTPGYLASIVTGVVTSIPVAGGGSTGGGTVVIGGTGAVVAPTPLTPVNLGTGGSVAYGITGWVYTATGGAVTQLQAGGQVYLWEGNAYKVVNNEIVFA